MTVCSMPSRKAFSFLLLGLPLLLVSCAAQEKQPLPAAEIPTYALKIKQVYPHDRGAFTQGLVYEDGILYEGTGQHGSSSIRKVRLETGEVLQQRDLTQEYFGEGIAIIGERLLQLTWTSKTGFVYDKATLEPIGQFRYLTEGWGLAYDGERLFMSDGTSELQILDPVTYEYKGFLTVRSGETMVERMNELECVNGEIWANIWPGDRIARIDLETGFVVGWIETGGLLSPEDYSEAVDVMNGIAWDAAGKRLFVTGKLWPKLFEVELVERPRAER